MADALVRLKIESQEYDNKIKRAQEGLTRYADECRKVGGTLEYVEKETLEYVKSLGQMDTVAKTTKGKIAELKNAYQELGVQYKQLTAAEKNSPYGQALQGSLQQLKGRFTELSGQLNTTNNDLNGGGGFSKALEAVSSKLGLPISSLSTLGAGLAAAAGAAKVAKDAFFNNEQQLDEWGRVTESAGSLYRGFLDALNTGNISGFLSNMGDIISAARDAYDAMDALNTFNAFNQINLGRARKDFDRSIADYREGKGTKEDVKTYAATYKNELTTRQKFEHETYLAKVRDFAKERNVNSDDLLKALSGTYGDYAKLKELPLTGKEYTYHANQFGGTYVTEKAVAANDMERLGDMLRRLNDEELNNLQALEAKAQQTADEIIAIDKQVTRFTGKGTGTATAGGINLGMLDGQKATVAALQEQWDNAGVDGATNKLWNDLDEGKRKLEEMEQAAAQLGQTLQSSFSVQAPANLNAELDKVHMTTRAVGTDSAVTAQGTGKAWSAAATAVATVGSALQQIEDPAAKVAGIVAVAIAQVAAGLGQMLAMPQSTAQSWGWIALAATGTATMISTITAIKSATSGYAEGGMVLPNGNPYGGDNIVARLNAGEGVLTPRGITTAEAMSQVQGAGLQAIQIHIDGRLRGRDILLAADTDNRIRGGSRGAFARIH